MGGGGELNGWVVVGLAIGTTGAGLRVVLVGPGLSRESQESRERQENAGAEDDKPAEQVAEGALYAVAGGHGCLLLRSAGAVAEGAVAEGAVAE